MGIYSDAGIFDCAFCPGSWGYEELDAQTYASWGIDYLKFDNCGQFEAATLSPYDRFAVMRDALKATNRSILYSMCSWGNKFPWYWADQVAYSYRMSGDIHLAFAEDSKGVCKTAYCLNQGYAGCSVTTIMRKMRELSPFQTKGAWLDMDMLEVGVTLNNVTMNAAQERTHFSFWAALKSPLIIGADLRKISSSSLDILKNRDIIKLNQDPLGIAPRYFDTLSREGQYQVWAGPLENDSIVVLVFNEGQQSQLDIALPVEQIVAALVDWKVIQPQGSWVLKRGKEMWSGDRFDLSGQQLTTRSIGWNDTAVYVLS